MNPVDSIINAVPMDTDARIFSVDPRFNFSRMHITLIPQLDNPEFIGYLFD